MPVENATTAGDALRLRQLVAALRAVLAVACLASLLRSWDQAQGWVVALACLFAVFSFAALTSVWERVPGQALLGLVLQTIFFLAYAAFGGGQPAVLSAALYFHLMLVTLLFHPWRDTAIIVAASVAFLAISRPAGAAPLLPVVVWLGLLAAAASVVRFRSERAFVESLQQAREARAAAEAARDADRDRLAGDFHDGPLQAFTGIQLRLEVLRKILEKKPELAMEELRAVQELARGHTAEMRAFLRGLRPVEVGEAGLASSVRQVVADFQKHSGLGAVFESHGSPAAGPEENWAELVQIVREALTNVQKHARASRVAVTLRCDRSQVEVSIADNGAGFPFSGAYTLEELELLRRGPFSIERRVRAIGGRLLLESRPQRGSTLIVQAGS
jgi:signal transduction histidine kinase